jgi:tetratricopeptide (TPR) repeat protein
MESSSLEFQNLRAAAEAAYEAIDFARMREIGLQMLGAGERSDDAEQIAYGHLYQGWANIHLQAGQGSKAALHAALTFFRTNGRKLEIAQTLTCLASIAIDVDVDAAESRRLFEEAWPLVQEVGTKQQAAALRGNLGEVCRLEGDLKAATECAHESLEMWRALDDPMRAAWQLTNIAHNEILVRRYSSAIRSLDLACDELTRAPNPLCVTWCFDVWIILAVKLEQLEVAARLLGFVEWLRMDDGLYRQQGMLPYLSEPIERLSRAFSDEEMQSFARDGERLSFFDARELASILHAYVK